MGSPIPPEHILVLMCVECIDDLRLDSPGRENQGGAVDGLFALR